MTNDAQQEVFDFLGDAASHGGAPVRRIDTHAATVFLAGDLAIKIKRAVRFAFLDYSSLPKRKAACEAEIEVNRAYAPAIYRRVVAITREGDGRLAIGGKGPPVEWAVEMRRFDESQTLDHLALAGRIDDVLADALGRAVARAHAAAPVVTDAAFPGLLAEIIAQNAAELRATPELFPTPAVTALNEAARDALERLCPLLVTRERASLVRRCHGDLHLGNIVLIGSEPVLFDAIEFDPKIASGDVLYDLAFLLMDLIERGLKQPANTVFNRYLMETRRLDDLDALAALPLFMSVRAAIRAKVTAARRTSNPADKTIAKKARDYFVLAQTLLAPPAPRLIAIGGLSGTGKSQLARALGAEFLPEPGALWLRSDVERKVLFGVAETDRLPETAYACDVTAKVYATLADKARRALAAGHSVIVDAVFADSGERAAITKVATDGAFHGLFLTADLATRLARLGRRAGDASDADAAVALAQEQYDLGTMDWVKVDASDDAAETLRRVKTVLGI
jgi:aminoglycoside phosphotransferase family enzyme/predicted kinase